jgi:hypothetical protein
MAVVLTEVVDCEAGRRCGAGSGLLLGATGRIALGPNPSIRSQHTPLAASCPLRFRRDAFQDAMRDDMVAQVERLTGRRVIAFLSDNHIDPDVAIECFQLAAAAD